MCVSGIGGTGQLGLGTGTGLGLSNKPTGLGLGLQINVAVGGLVGGAASSNTPAIELLDKCSGYWSAHFY